MIRDSLRELAIRLALGAGTARLVRRVLYQGPALTVAGTAAGIVAARFVVTSIGDQLYRTAATDPLIFGAAVGGSREMIPGVVSIALLRPQRHNGIHPRRPARRQPRGQER